MSEPAPPSGMAPPTSVELADGAVLELRPLAQEITRRHLQAHPDELTRYGEGGREWCTHDNQHLVNWAALELAGALSFQEQLSWLGHVLISRGYPLANLADDLDTAAQTARELVPGAEAERLAAVLSDGAGFVRGRLSDRLG